MKPNEYESILSALTEQLHNAGLTSLADPTHYTRLDRETGEQTLLGVERRVIEMLRAFERHLAVRDHRTFKRALMSINETLDDGRLTEVVVEPVESQSAMPTSVSLESAPDLSQVRRELSAFIAALEEDAGVSGAGGER